MSAPTNLRNVLRAGLPSAVKRETERQESAGMMFQSYLDKSKLPVGRHIFRKFPEGTTVFDIIPFICEKDFAGETAGAAVRMYTVWVHPNIGPRNHMVLCPTMMENKPCPVCEDMTHEQAKGAEWKAYSHLRPRSRNLCLIIARDKHINGKEEIKGIQVLDMATFNLGEHLSKIERNPVTGEFILYADPDNGKHISINRKGTGSNNTSYTGHQLVDRARPITDAELEQGFDPAVLCTVLSYDEIKALYVPAAEKAPIPDNVATSPEEAFKGAPASEPAPAPTPRSESVPVPEPASASVPEPELAKPTPTPTPKKTLAPPPPPAPTSKLVCPFAESGGILGASFDTFQECATCEIFDDCATLADTMERSN